MYLIPDIGMFELPAAGGGYLFTGGLFDGPVTAGTTYPQLERHPVRGVLRGLAR